MSGIFSSDELAVLQLFRTEAIKEGTVEHVVKDCCADDILVAVSQGVLVTALAL